MRLILVSLILITFTLLQAACNTMEGVGKDTKKAGQSIENAADRNK